MITNNFYILLDGVLVQKKRNRLGKTKILPLVAWDSTLYIDIRYRFSRRA
jgi:hypothetical protein